ncbi:hypothetical protein [Burkholderia ubonensis]|uniref:Uncharacterized protein n=1 Tax=Burkholderia ubonensis subsp. mesacidophila TaxID=265293 RepID=A0A2A4FHR0_9BURK|nr:hypothetical protein [Burkholderia ubonensis]PCE33263.1 hypothetical protein BZL54_05990 [Burkholderia ubonensis subsp. mesacidophila]
MKLDIRGTGPGIAELEHLDDLPVELRDPVRMFADLINAGFVVPDDPVSRRPERPRVVLTGPRFSDARDTAAWHIDAPGLPVSHLLIAKNLLGMRAIEASFVAAGNHEPLTLENVDFPRHEASVPFAFTVDLDESVPIRGCMIYVQYRAPLEKARADQLCKQFSIWGNVAMCGGFTPPGVAPGKAGTLFVAAFQYDPGTIALEFEECFAIDFASFELIKRFLLEQTDAGNPVVDVTVE